MRPKAHGRVTCSPSSCLSRGTTGDGRDGEPPLGLWRAEPSVHLGLRVHSGGLRVQAPFSWPRKEPNVSGPPPRPPPPVTACSCAFPSRCFLLKGKRKRLCGFCSGGFLCHRHRTYEEINNQSLTPPPNRSLPDTGPGSSLL